MRVIIAGSRTATYDQVRKAISLCPFKEEIVEVVSGGAVGADKFGEVWAVDNHVPFVRYPANWKEFGKAAGMIRNREMAENAHALILVWDTKSKGSKNMLEEATKRGLKVFVHMIKPTKEYNRPKLPKKDNNDDD